jgi:hypothetical protein
VLDIALLGSILPSPQSFAEEALTTLAGGAAFTALAWLPLRWVARRRARRGQAFIAALPTEDRAGVEAPGLPGASPLVFPMPQKEPLVEEDWDASLDGRRALTKRLYASAFFDHPVVLLDDASLVVRQGPARQAVIQLDRITSVSVCSAGRVKQRTKTAYYTPKAYRHPTVALKVEPATEVLRGRLAPVRRVVLQVNETESFLAALKSRTGLPPLGPTSDSVWKTWLFRDSRADRLETTSASAP